MSWSISALRSTVLNSTLKPLNYQNLDVLPQFAGVLTTTEFLCKHIFDAMAAAARSGALGEDASGLSRIRVTLHETDLARGELRGCARVSEIAFAIPGDLDLPTGGYAYDRRLLAEWRASGVAARHLPLPGSFPGAYTGAIWRRPAGRSCRSPSIPPC